jgi:hypothetical protein
MPNTRSHPVSPAFVPLEAAMTKQLTFKDVIYNPIRRQLRLAHSGSRRPSLRRPSLRRLDLSRPNPLPAVMRSSRRTPKHPELLIVR